MRTKIKYYFKKYKDLKKEGAKVLWNGQEPKDDQQVVVEERTTFNYLHPVSVIEMKINNAHKEIDNIKNISKETIDLLNAQILAAKKIEGKCKSYIKNIVKKAKKKTKKELKKSSQLKEDEKRVRLNGNY